MPSVNLLRIVELMGEGSLATAEELIKAELNERYESAMEDVKSTMVGLVMETSVTNNVDRLGEVTVDAARGEVRLEISGLSEALQKAVNFAAFCDSGNESQYDAFLNESQTAIIIESGGQSLYELLIEDNQLVNHCPLSTQDLLEFKMHGTLASE